MPDDIKQMPLRMPADLYRELEEKAGPRGKNSWVVEAVRLRLHGRTIESERRERPTPKGGCPECGQIALVIRSQGIRRCRAKCGWEEPLGE